MHSDETTSVRDWDEALASGECQTCDRGGGKPRAVMSSDDLAYYLICDLCWPRIKAAIEGENEEISSQ